METRKGSKKDLADEVPRMFWFSVRLIAVMSRGGKKGGESDGAVSLGRKSDEK